MHDHPTPVTACTLSSCNVVYLILLWYAVFCNALALLLLSCCMYSCKLCFLLYCDYFGGPKTSVFKTTLIYGLNYDENHDTKGVANGPTYVIID